ncbi:MAG: DUF6010 family protein [Gammaproteobacteria bacterium]
MHFAIWFCIGLLAAWPVLWIVSRQSPARAQQTLGLGLIVAALIYPGFALLRGDVLWLMLEFAGVFTYGMFYLLSIRFSVNWLAIGWLAHPLWDALLHLGGPAQHIAPHWYAIACIPFDIAVAVYVFVRLHRPAHA